MMPIRPTAQESYNFTKQMTAEVKKAEESINIELCYNHIQHASIKLNRYLCTCKLTKDQESYFKNKGYTVTRWTTQNMAHLVTVAWNSPNPPSSTDR